MRWAVDALARLDTPAARAVLEHAAAEGSEAERRRAVGALRRITCAEK